METKATPGPWKVSSNLSSHVCGASGQGLIAICDSGDYAQSKGQGEANARLIAAAPDLLAACQLGIKLLDNMTTNDFSKGADKPLHEAMYAAIVKEMQP